MIAKPIGFDNWKSYFFVSKDGSNGKFFKKGSFVATEGSMFRIYRGPSIAATNSATDILITTTEAHGFKVGQSVRFAELPADLADLAAGSDPTSDNGEWVILTVPSTSTFTVDFDASTAAPTTNTGVVGIAGNDFINSSDYNVVQGRNCMDEATDPWELPWEG